MRHAYAWVLALLLSGLASAQVAADFTITEQVLRPRDQVPPLGANNWGRCGAVEWAANNFVHNSGNEPVHWRNLHRAINVGPNWFEIDGPGTSWWDLWGNGFLSGADLRIYRIVDAAGQPLPLAADYFDVSQADHVAFVGKARVIPEGAPDFPDGGWIATKYADVHPNAWIRHGNLSATDASGVTNGRTYWYTVVAVSADNQESAPANEVSAAPLSGGSTGPLIAPAGNDDRLPELAAGRDFDFTPRAGGGAAPLRWEVLDQQGQPTQFPAGLALQLEPASGRLHGRPAADAKDLHFQLRVTDAQGRSDTRWFVINPAAPAERGKPEPPRGLRAVAGDGRVTLTWQASPSPGVVAYRLKRSVAPGAEQMQRVFVEPGAPELKRLDYVVLSKRFNPFDMRLVNSRVRGIGNPMDSPGWYWNTDLSRVKLALVPHPKPAPADMLDPGETCLRATAEAGEQTLHQYTFIGTEMGGESVWYGQLEPGKSYRWEVWLRQEGLANGGAVNLSFGRGYPELRHAVQVAGAWAQHTWDFSGPERPGQQWHFGPTLTFTGPGTLWLDNCRVFRYDRPEDLARLYVPNPTVMDELLASQPAAGPKGAHRIWFLARDATMQSILSWHASSAVRPDWNTRVEGTLDMTLPMGLEFDRLTGPTPQTRMRPWLVFQHVLHSEDDWRAFVEYLAAPYDPAKDTPQSKPWAYLRTQQRRVRAPWTDEFTQLTLEFGNETWHNGVFDDWLGFRIRNWVHGGGPEYGLFCRYLIGVIQGSPYFPAGKLRFNLGANYDGRVDPDGTVRGYGEEAVQTCPEATLLGHANYVGPKWETGDASSGTFDDHGVQETLLGFLTGARPGQEKMAKAQAALAGLRPPYDLAAYEGGPSGYALPGRDSPPQREANERYGKSLAMAVAALDAWLGSYALGWTDQCFLGYGQGTYWNSHTPMWDGFRPSPGWQALALRNRYASGDMMTVEERAVPTLQRGNAAYPLIGVYALRDGARWSVFVLSRKLGGRHDGVDFGDGATPVTLHLPVLRAQRITLHKLTGDPRANNRQSLSIVPQEQDVPAGELRDGTLNLVMPEGSIYLYVIEGA